MSSPQGTQQDTEQYTAQQRDIRDRARALATERLGPLAAELDATERFPTESFQALAERGLLGVNVAREHGGLEAGTVALTLALGEVAYACASTAVGMSVTNMVGETLCTFASPDLQARYVRSLTSGAAVAGAFCLSEPGSGSDAASLRTTARREGDRWILDGSKLWITSGAHAGVLIVLARTAGPEAGHRGISAFVVEPHFAGFSAGPAEDKAGLRGSNTVPITLDACEVPEANLVGEPGIGFRIAMTALDGGRVTIGAMANGIARAALDTAAAWLAADRTLSRSQAASYQLADMATGLEAAELMVSRAAALKEAAAGSGRRFTREAAMAKLFATENAKRLTSLAVDLMGEAGYRRGGRVERLMRDCRVTTIFEGTSEIQRLVIAREAYQLAGAR